MMCHDEWINPITKQQVDAVRLLQSVRFSPPKKDKALSTKKWPKTHESCFSFLSLSQSSPPHCLLLTAPPFKASW